MTTLSPKIPRQEQVTVQKYREGVMVILDRGEEESSV